MNWVTVKRFAELSGYTQDAIRGKILQGVWLEGRVWKHAPDNRVLISVRGYEEWVEETASLPPVKAVSKSASRSAV